MVSQNLARNIWINAVEREENEKEDLLAKVSVHHIRQWFEQYIFTRSIFMRDDNAALELSIGPVLT